MARYKRPDSHRLIRVVLMSFALIVDRWACVFSALKRRRHRITPVDGLIINTQRSRTPFVFKIRLIPLRSVFDSDTDKPRHTLCVRLSNAFFCLPLHTLLSLHIYLRHNAHMHDHCQSTCRLLFIFFLFFIGCDPQMYTVGGRLVSTSVTAQAVICTTVDF